MIIISKIELECETGTGFQIEPWGFLYNCEETAKVEIEYKDVQAAGRDPAWPFIGVQKQNPICFRRWGFGI